MEKIAVIIVNWNTGRLLANCVQSLLTVSDRVKLAEVLVIDNHSHDASMELARRMVASTPSNVKLTLLEMKQNAGFAGGNNIGIRRIQQDYAGNLPHVLLLNPDTVVHDGALSMLHKALVAYPNAGIIGPHLVNPDGSHQPSVRAFPSLGVLLALLLKLPRILPKSGWWGRYMQIYFDYTIEQAVDQVMGAAFLIRDQVLDQKHPRYVGPLDDGYFVWFEEVDYCRSAKKAGWEVRYTPTATVTHYGGVSFAQLVGFKRTWPWVKSALRYSRKHLGWPSTVMVGLVIPFTLLLTVPSSLAHLLFKKRNQKRLDG